MFHKFLLSQAINIASLTIAELIRKHHNQFDIEKTREKIHANIRVIIKPNFLGEKLVEDKAIKAADWLLERVCDAMESGADVVGPVLNAATASDWKKAVALIQGFAKGVLRIGSEAEGEGSGDDTEFLVGAYLEENPGEIPQEPEQKESSESGQNAPQTTQTVYVQGNSVTDSMQPPEAKLDMQQGQQPFIKGNENQPTPPEVQQKKEELQKEGEK